MKKILCLTILSITLLIGGMSVAMAHCGICEKSEKAKVEKCECEEAEKDCKCKSEDEHHHDEEHGEHHEHSEDEHHDDHAEEVKPSAAE